jgi:predicted DNA-binding transcriptional regulator AlpA
MTRALQKPRDSLPRMDTPRARAKPPVGNGARPPSYVSRKELAWELSISESTVDELIRRGVIPPPIRLTDSCVRWWWSAVEAALASVGGAGDDGDPYMVGAANAT